MTRGEAMATGCCLWGGGRAQAMGELRQEPVCGAARAEGDAAYCSTHREATKLPGTALPPRELRTIASYYAWRDRQGQVVW